MEKLHRNVIIARGTKVSVDVQVGIMYEEGSGEYIAYCPALNVSSFGESQKDAMRSIDQAIKLFVEETCEKGTFNQCLLDLGWRIMLKPIPEFRPPKITRQVFDEFSGGEPILKRVEHSINFPVAAYC